MTAIEPWLILLASFLLPLGAGLNLLLSVELWKLRRSLRAERLERASMKPAGQPPVHRDAP